MIPRIYGWLAAAAVVFLMGLGTGYLVFRPDPRPAAELEANARQVAIADTVLLIEQARTDTVRQVVDRLVTRWRTDTAYRADTLTLRDTLRVLVPAAQFDSTIRACALLSVQVLGERSACAAAQRVRDERIELLERPDPWFKRRLGCSAGYGAVLSEGAVRHGVGGSCGLKF